MDHFKAASCQRHRVLCEFFDAPSAPSTRSPDRASVLCVSGPCNSPPCRTPPSPLHKVETTLICYKKPKRCAGVLSYHWSTDHKDLNK